MSEEAVVIFFVPKKYVAPEDNNPWDVIQLLHVPGKTLKQYYSDTRFTHHLNQKNTRHTVRKENTREPVRTSYVPQENERFVFTRGGGGVNA